MDNYRQIEWKVGAKREFYGNSARGIKDNEGNYKIYSYQTLIYNSKDNFFDTNYYSNTTSRIQGIIARKIFGKSLKEMRNKNEKTHCLYSWF